MKLFNSHIQFRFRFLLELIFVSAGLFLFSFTLQSQSWKQYPYHPEGSAISFPKDEGRHSDEPIEWWYIAGHLHGVASGTDYSFMLTYFYYPVYGFDGFRILNICNDNTGEFYSETLPLNYNVMDSVSLDIHATLMNDNTEFWSTRQEQDGTLIPLEYDISARSANARIDLGCISLKPPLILGDSGLFYQGSQSYTYYYSLTEMEIEGNLNFSGFEEAVTGSAWIDRQYGSFNPLSEEKYEWFFVQLSNGMDINIWNVFTPENLIPNLPEYKHISVYVDSSTHYTTLDFKIERLAYSFMQDGAMCYSQKWHLTSEVNQIDLILTTLHHHTEVQLPFRFYEGSLSVEGSVNGSPVSGVGFAELLKSYEPPLTLFTAPVEASWNDTIPISWHLQNPDDGRPVLYDLEYSIDRGNIFSQIETGMEDSLFFWNNPPLFEGDSIWLKLTAYSSDATLLSSIASEEALVYSPEATGIPGYGNGKIEHHLTIYPVPASNTLFVESAMDLSQMVYEVIDFTGRVVLTGRFSLDSGTTGIDISKLTRGSYIMRFFGKDYLGPRTFIVSD